MTKPQVLCVGETLWDQLGAAEFLGGAPLNVAVHLARLGIPAALASRVGNDSRGCEARRRLSALGVDTSLLAVDPTLPTGTAQAKVDAAGIASYSLPFPAAWDALEADRPTLTAASAASAIVFGTLALRSPTGRSAAQRIAACASWRVLDVNLRPPHADPTTVRLALSQADFVKLNDDEVRILCGWFDVRPTPDALRAYLAEALGVQSVCVTSGAGGARLWHRGTYTELPAVPTSVVDTIGAGDAFLAMLLSELLRGSEAQVAMDRARHLAAFVVSRAGATPDFDPSAFRH